MTKILTSSLSILFLLSSMMKAVNIHSFAMETGEFIDLYMPEWLHGWQMACAMMVCVVELVLGMLAWDRRFRLFAIGGMTCLLAFFVYLTGVNAFMPTMFGSIESCGCFGELIHFSPLASFVKSVILLAMASTALVMLVRTVDKSQIGKDLSGLAKDWTCSLPVVFGGLLVGYSYLFVNSMEHVSYICGYIFLCCCRNNLPWFPPCLPQR